MSRGSRRVYYQVAIIILICGILYSRQASHWRLLTTVSHPHAPAFTSVVFSNPNTGWGLTTSQLLATDDGGKTWSEKLSDETKTFYGLQFVTPFTGFIVGTQRIAGDSAPLVLRTNDSGKTWVESPLGVSLRQEKAPTGFQSIRFTDEKTGWIAGFGVIAHTDDGGESWEIQRDRRDSEIIFGVDALNPETAFAVGENGLILRTTDGGRNWMQESPVNTERLLRIRFFGNTGWIVGSNGTLLQSKDGGESWQKIQVNTTEDLMDIYVKDTDGWIVGARGLILHGDGSGQWSQQKSPTDSDLTTLFFAGNSGWIGGSQQTVLQLAE